MRIGLIGYGTVGQGVADLLGRHGAMYARRAGRPLELVAILVRNAERQRDVAPPTGALLTDEPKEFWGVGFDLLIEAAGPVGPAHEAITRALGEGLDVVTANKALIASRGAELLPLAESSRRRLAFEAAVAGGLPIIETLRTGLASNRIHAITGILNATCNFILSRMIAEECGYPAALAAARARGYAEADPTLDISGRDAAEKIAILAALAFGRPVHPDDIPTRGLDDIELEDLHLTETMGHTVKLIAEARRAPDPDDDSGVTLRVAPMLVPHGHPLAGVHTGQLAAIVEADAVARTFMIADAAGRLPTASAVLADVIRLARLSDARGGTLNVWPMSEEPLVLSPPGAIRERAYVRLHVMHHDNAYDLFREHMTGAGVEIDALQETPHTIAAITGPAPASSVEAAASDPIAKAFDERARVVLPVLGSL